MISLLVVFMVVMLMVKFWHLLAAAVVFYAGWHWGIRPCRQARARRVRERLRHAHARQEIDDITFATALAMYNAAATPDGDVIESTAIEVKP